MCAGLALGAASGVAAGQSLAAAQHRPAPAAVYSVSGTVADRDGHALPDAEITLVERDTALRLVRTDTAGRFEMSNLTVPAVTLRIRRLGFKPRRMDLNLSRDEGQHPLMIQLEVMPAQLARMSVTDAIDEPDGKLRMTISNKERVPEPVVAFELPLPGGTRKVTVTSMGNPHCSIHVDDFEWDWKRVGALIENHSYFPNRTNVEFYRVLSNHEIEVRFWERGVGMTLSSGTGSCGASVAAILNGLVKSPVTVRTLAETLAKQCAQALLRAKRRESEERTRAWTATTLRCIADAVIATDREGRVTFMNPIAERLTE